MPQEQPSQDKGGARLRLWEVLAWLLAALILVTAWLPGWRADWSRASILLLLLALAGEWLVLKRIYRHQHAARRRRDVVTLIMSVLFALSAIILAISSRR
jgi:hypothetical protein